MNYFAHGRHFVDQPYLLAGTAVPDWLCVVNRRAKARARLAEPYCGDPDPQRAAVARGIVRHHEDDRWFHQTQAFVELNLQFTVAIRERLGRERGFRPAFLAHLLVELLLDAALIEAEPQRLDDYYRAVAELDPHVVSRAVNRMSTQPTGMLALFISRFSAERFLYDYTDDEKLLFRVRNVIRRVGLTSPPDSLVEFLPTARDVVRRRASDLLVGEEPQHRR